MDGAEGMDFFPEGGKREKTLYCHVVHGEEKNAIHVWKLYWLLAMQDGRPNRFLAKASPATASAFGRSL